MKFFLPDSQDLVDPTFDFETERRALTRLRQRDELYAHETFSRRMLDGLLISKGIVDGFGETGSRYTRAQRLRLMSLGAPQFFRTERVPWGAIELMGDCGAFTYVNEEVPPYDVDEVLEFYAESRFDYGISVDHVILAYQPDWDGPRGRSSAPPALKARQELTLELARKFLARHKRNRLGFTPLGVAQGWSPRSYAHAVRALQRMGYGYIALGGMVPLKTVEILSCLEEIATVRAPQTQLHLLGISRTDQTAKFEKFGVASFDSTSPLRQAFKDAKENYHTLGEPYVAVRIPQVEGNPRLQQRIATGKVSQEKARKLERACLDAMRRLDAGEARVGEVLEALEAYDELCEAKGDHREAYEKVLTERPWRECDCEVCRQLGYHVILFRGAERNRRRGFHNTWVFYQRLQLEQGARVRTVTRRGDLFRAAGSK